MDGILKSPRHGATSTIPGCSNPVQLGFFSWKFSLNKIRVKSPEDGQGAAKSHNPRGHCGCKISLFLQTTPKNSFKSTKIQPHLSQGNFLPPKIIQARKNTQLLSIQKKITHQAETGWRKFCQSLLWIWSLPAFPGQLPRCLDASGQPRNADSRVRELATCARSNSSKNLGV